MINVDFYGRVRTPAIKSSVVAMPTPNVAFERVRQQLLDTRRRNNELGEQLRSAMSALECANADIGRLNAELDDLKGKLEKCEAELQKEKAASAAAPKKKGRKKEEAPQENASDPIQETNAE